MGPGDPDSVLGHLLGNRHEDMEETGHPRQVATGSECPWVSPAVDGKMEHRKDKLGSYHLGVPSVPEQTDPLQSLLSI